MAGRGRGQGHGHGQGPGAPERADQHPGGPFGGANDGTDDAPEQGGIGQSQMDRGSSEQSPGHLKKAAGAQSARDFAPGRARR